MFRGQIGHLVWELLVDGLCCGKDEERCEWGYILQEWEEAALDRLTDGFPPVTDVRHVDDAGYTAPSLTKHLHTDPNIHTHTHTHTHTNTPGVTNERIHSYVENKVDSVRWLPSSHILSTTTVLQAHSTTHWTCEVFKSDGVFRLAWAQDSSGVLALTEYSVGRSRRCTVNFSRWCSTAGARCVLCPTPWGPDSSSRGR